MAKSSANTLAAQTPSKPQIRGNSKTPATCNTSVLINDITAEISPLFSAVKNDELYIANPMNRKQNA